MTAAALISLGALAPAEDVATLNFTYSGGYFSRYVWRGLVVDSEPAYQSDIWLEYGPWSFNVWTTGRKPRAAWLSGSDEVDFAVYRAFSTGGLTVEPSLTYFDYAKPVGESDTVEAGLYLEYPLGQATLFSNHFADLRTAKGAYYVDLGVQMERDASSLWSWRATLGLAWANRKFNDFNVGHARSGLQGLFGTAEVSYRLSPGWTLKSNVAASSLFGNGLRRAAGDPDQIVWSIVAEFGG